MLNEPIESQTICGRRYAFRRLCGTMFVNGQPADVHVDHQSAEIVVADAIGTDDDPARDALVEAVAAGVLSAVDGEAKRRAALLTRKRRPAA